MKGREFTKWGFNKAEASYRPTVPATARAPGSSESAGQAAAVRRCGHGAEWVTYSRRRHGVSRGDTEFGAETRSLARRHGVSRGDTESRAETRSLAQRHGVPGETPGARGDKDSESRS
jgi:hypothetical protein